MDHHISLLILHGAGRNPARARREFDAILVGLEAMERESWRMKIMYGCWRVAQKSGTSGESKTSTKSQILVMLMLRATT